MNIKLEYQEIKMTLAELDLSVAWAARQIGVSGAYLSMIFAGKVEPGASLKIKIFNLHNKLKTSGLLAV